MAGVSWQDIGAGPLNAALGPAGVSMRDIEAIAAALLRIHPELHVEQLRVAHPGADDDGIWFVSHPSGQYKVQLESTNGMCPFLVESDGSDARAEAASVEDAVALVVARLGLRG